MKKIYTILVAVLITASIFAQVPEKMTYQAVIRNSVDLLVTDQGIGMQISILQSSVTGTAVYIERHFPTTNINGLVTIEIGTGIIVSGDFTTIDWANDIYFIKTETDLNGGASYTITGTSQLLSVAYALHAKTAETIIGGISETDPIFTAWDKTTGIAITESQITDLQTYLITEIDGSNTNELQDISINGHDITITNGSTITIPDNVTDADADESNEIQNLSQVLTQSNDAGATNITNLADPVNAQDAATKAYVDLLEARIYALEHPPITLTDFDGNSYGAIEIGTQVWMSENLKVTHYPNGDAIPLVTDNTAWANLTDDNTSDAYSYFNNNASSEADTYGALYTYAAAIGDDWARDNTANQGVCPDGWHLPTDSEWTTLETYLGSNAGSKLAGNEPLWQFGSLDQSADFGTSGFSALPGGCRLGSGSFYGLGYYGYWCSATEYDVNDAYACELSYNQTTVNHSNYIKSFGFMVRCLRD